ncbi:zf-DHHC-domain-containing protein, partial [Dendrothele bispora CBS 962.96]
ITGAAGPFFITFVVVLISTGTVCSFDVIYPTLPFKFLTGLICTLIALNMFTHYYLVCMIPPGFVDAEGPRPPKTFPQRLLRTSPKRPTENYAYRALSPSENGFRGDERTGRLNVTRAEITKCRKCGQMRPERAHYCRICNCYVIKYDDHCPVRINQCVGIYNVAPSKFFLFLSMYLCLSTALYVVLGYQQFLNALGLSFQISWPYHVPVIAYLTLSCVLCFAVGIMFIVALWSVMKDETSVEAQDHRIYEKVFINLEKMQNLKLFFDIGEGGYPIYTLFIPFCILPYTDGRSWARREGFERHRGVRRGEELTDDEIDENDL